MESWLLIHMSLTEYHVQNMDLQYAIGIATAVPIDFISVGLNNTDGVYGFLDEINFLNNQQSVPTVLTSSYSFEEETISENLAKYVSYSSSVCIIYSP